MQYLFITIFMDGKAYYVPTGRVYEKILGMRFAIMAGGGSEKAQLEISIGVKIRMEVHNFILNKEIQQLISFLSSVILLGQKYTRPLKNQDLI